MKRQIRSLIGIGLQVIYAIYAGHNPHRLVKVVLIRISVYFIIWVFIYSFPI